MAQTKQQKEVIALAALLVVAVFVWYFYFGKSKTTADVLSSSGNYVPINVEDYGAVFEPLKSAQSTEYKSSGRNIFIAGPPPASPVSVAAEKAAPKRAHLPIGPMPDPEPPPPQLTMKFFGYGTVPSNGQRRAFLLDPNGEEVHIVEEGDTIQNHIRITHIGNDRIEYEDINTGKKNSSTLEMPPAV
jgi:hypothetical protein